MREVLMSNPCVQGSSSVTDVRVGYVEASRIAVQNGTRIMLGTGRAWSLVNLYSREVDGQYRAMWGLPHVVDGLINVGVCADTGQLTYRRYALKDEWTATKPRY